MPHMMNMNVLIEKIYGETKEQIQGAIIPGFSFWHFEKTQGEKNSYSRKKLNNSSKILQVLEKNCSMVIKVTFAWSMGKTLGFFLRRNIFSPKTSVILQKLKKMLIKISNHFLKTQGNNSFFRKSIIPHCRN